ncbi:TetR/AcrR family transcriptional regulator C-terminal domain-containing protein [Streptomyces sp. NPDC051162]|uniref:TetR/AcrR family transcriptional regulator C-terminal domain-containing protein n=1 Tax=unclassified Streptomyces TaxID=2593676 RepID=UPI00342AF75A
MPHPGRDQPEEQQREGAAYVSNELSAAERARTSPYPPEQEQAARTAYLTRALADGAYPRLAKALASGPEQTDSDAVFDRVVDRILDGFDDGSRGGS